MTELLIDAALMLAMTAAAVWVVRSKLRARADHRARFQSLAQALGLQFEGDALAGATASARAELQQSATGRAGLAVLAALPNARACAVSGRIDGVPVRIELQQATPTQLVTAAQARWARPLANVPDSLAQRARTRLQSIGAAWIDEDALHLKLPGAVSDTARWRRALARMAEFVREHDAAAGAGSPAATMPGQPGRAMP
jgi:hypothetical protein